MAKEMTIIEKLNRLADLREVQLSLTLSAEEYIEQAFRYSPDLKGGYDRVQEELKVLAERELELTSQIKEAVIKSKESVKGELLHAIFSKGKTSWDTTKLEGYAIAHPELNELKKVGNPSIQIRPIK